MKVIVMFDLPTGTKTERKSYTSFRKNLLADGYTMIQFSVYTKTCLGVPECRSCVKRIKSYLPEAGSVTAFIMTEKQYAEREILVAPGNKPPFDPGEQLTLSF